MLDILFDVLGTVILHFSIMFFTLGIPQMLLIPITIFIYNRRRKLVWLAILPHTVVGTCFYMFINHSYNVPFILSDLFILVLSLAIHFAIIVYLIVAVIFVVNKIKAKS